MIDFNKQPNLETTLGRIKVNIKCPHRKQNDFTYHHFKDDDVDVDAYMCSGCLPRYYNIMNGYQNAKVETPMIDDDEFDEQELRYKFPDER